MSGLIAVLNEGRPQPDEVERLLGVELEHEERHMRDGKYDAYIFRNSAEPVPMFNSNYSLYFVYKGRQLVNCTCILNHRPQRGMPFNRVKKICLDALREPIGGVLTLREEKRDDSGLHVLETWKYDYNIPLRGGRVQRADLSIRKRRGHSFLSWQLWSLIQHNQFQRLWLRCDESATISIDVQLGDVRTF